MDEEYDEFGIPLKKSTENKVDEYGIPIKKKVDEVALAKGKENVAKLTNFNFDLPIEKQDVTKQPEVIVEELNETRNKQVDFIKKQIDDNIENIETQDQSIFKEQLRTSILEKTGNATIADEADSYIDEKLDDKLILDTEVQEQIISPENQQVFDNIAAAKNEELLGADAEAVVERAKEDQGDMFTPNDKVYKDYANYLSRKDEDKWKNYNEGVYSKGDEKGFNFYSEALTHQSNLNKIKLKGGAIDEKTFLLQQKDLQNKFQNNLVKFPEYQKEVNAQVERQTELDTSYDQAKKDIVSGDATEKLKAAHVLGYYNVVAPAVATFTKMGSGIISTAGRITAMSIPGESERYVNNFIDDIDSYFNTEKASSIYKAPSQLKGSLFEKGEMNAELLLPKVSETAANMFGLLYGGAAISEELVGVGVTSKIAPKIGLFTSSFMSTQNQYYIDAKENGMSHDEAMSYSLTASTVTSLLEGVSPQKYLTGGGVKKISKSMLKDMTGTSTLNTIKKNAAFSMKEMGLEMLQEESQELGDNATNYVFNNLTGSDLKTSTSLDEHAELLTLTAILSGGASVSGYSSSNSVRAESFYTAMKNNEDFANVLSKDNLVKDLGEDAVKQAQSDLKTYTEEFNKLPDSLNEGQKMFLASQTIDKKKRQSNVNKLNSVDEKIDVSREVAEEEKQIEIINSQMEEVLGDKAVKVEGEQGSKTEEKTPIEETGVKMTPKEEAQRDEAFKQRDEEVSSESTMSYKEQQIHENLGRIKSSDFDHYSDKNNREGNSSAMNVKYFGKNAMPLDSQAQIMSEDAGVEITPQDIVDYINSRESNPEKYLKKKEVKKDIKESKPQEMSDEMKDWLGEDSDFTEPQFHAAANLMSEYKGKKIPAKELKNAIAKDDIDILKNTEWYNELSEKQQYTFEYDFKKAMGEDVSKLEKPKTVKDVNNKKRELNTEIRERKNSKKHEDNTDEQLESELATLESLESVSKEQEIKIESIVTELNRREKGETALTKMSEEDIKKAKSTLDAEILDIKSENPVVKKKARTLLKEKIKTIKTSLKKGGQMKKKEISALQKDIKDYANDMLKQYNLSPAKHKQVTNTIVKAVSVKELKNAFSSINKMVGEAIESKRKDTIKGIYKILGNKKETLKKKAGKWVGKVEPEVQKFIREYDTSNLDSLTLQEAEDIMVMIKGKLKESAAVVKAKERVKRAEKRRVAANVFEDLYSRKTKTVNTKEELEEALSDQRNVAIINGQLITSKNSLKEAIEEDGVEIKEEDSLDSFIEDNPEYEFSNVKIYTLRTKDDALKARKGSKVARFKDAMRYMGLSIYGSANLELNLSPLYRGSKKIRQAVDNIVRSIAESDYKYEKNTIELQKKYSDRMVEVMSEKNKAINLAKKTLNGENVAARRLSKDSKVKVYDAHEDSTPSNSLMIDYYNMYQTETGKVKMDNDSAFNVEALLDYMNDPKNADLKAYADLLMNEIYPELKKRYESTYEAITGRKFDEGIYYPLYTDVEKSLELQSEGMSDNSNNLSSFKSFAKSMIARTKNSKNLNYNTGSHEKLTDYITSMERVHQFKETSDLVSATFNKASIPEMVKKVGERKFKAMRDHLDISITGVDPRAGKDNVGKKVSAALTSAVVLVSLPLKPVSLITQPVSFLHFSAAEGVKIEEWLAGFAKVPGNIKLLKELANSTYIKSRWSAASKDIEIKRILKSPKANIASEAKNKSIQVAMSPISFGDIIGVLGGASPMIIARFKHHRDTGMNIEEAIETAIMDVAIESESAQQSSRAYQTSHLQRDAYGRMFTIYKSSQISATNKMFNAVQKLKEWKSLTRGEKAHYTYQLAYFSGSSMLFSLARKGSIGAAATIVYKSIALAMGMDDEELTEEERRLIHDTALDVTQSKLDGAGIPGWVSNSAINYMRGQEYYNNVPALEVFNKTWEAGDQAIGFYSTHKSWGDLTKKEKTTMLKPIPLIGNIFKLDENLKRYESGHKTLYDALINVRNNKENKLEAPHLKEDNIWDMYNDTPYSYSQMTSAGKSTDSAARVTKKAMEDVPEAPYSESWKYKTE